MGAIDRSLAAGLLAALLATGSPVGAEETSEGLSPVQTGRASPFAGKSPEERVRELADREEIRELIAIYAHRAALGIPIADMFTDDGAFIVHVPGQPLTEARGREALEAAYADVAAQPRAQLPMIHNIALDIAGDEARGVCSIELRGSHGGQNVIASGYYEDSYRREDGRWKFVTREVFFFHFTTLEKGWATPAQ
ncbi:MAG: nuclear transport factor 2 family protein [Novosphingobium sp.]|nr:nuclear transport factor 2 family protein [Novosphingobium sp.]MCP5401654.1 nuclear transport factor 2 family protein [Novosphingobium sp.]